MANFSPLNGGNQTADAGAVYNAVECHEQLELEISCADSTAHAGKTICYSCGWSRLYGPLPWQCAP
jgi:hypothetical protein